MASFKLKQFTEKIYDDNTNIDGTPITCYLGADSKDVDFPKGTIGVVEKGKIPPTNTTYATTDLLFAGTSEADVLARVQFFGVLQMAVLGYKIKQNAGEDKECSMQFYGGRNIYVLSPENSTSTMQKDSVPIGSQVFMWPHLTAKKQNNTATNLYEFQAVTLAVLNVEAARIGLAVTDELLSRLYVGRADMGKSAGYLNMPVAIGPASH